MNLVSMAMNFITPAIISRIASALGIDSKIAQMAIGAALPSILAGVVGKSSTPSGLSALTGLLGQQDSGMLSNLAGMIGGSDQSKLVNAGSGALGSLLGNSALGGLTGAIGKFAGMGEAPTKSLLGMLAPVALGTIAQQQKSSGLDAAGLASMLMGQKQNIANSMPAGFADALKGTGLLDGFPKASVSNVVGSAAQSVGSAASSAASGARNVAQDAASAARSAALPVESGFPSWLKWGALLAAILGGWYLLGPGSGRRIAAPPTKIMHNNVDVAAQVNSAYDGLRTTITGIRDEASARAALPKLQDATKSLDSLTALRGQMAPAARGDLATLIGSYLPLLRPLINTALGAAGVSGVAKPVLDGILSKMEALSKA